MDKVNEFSDVALKSLTNIWLEITKIFPNIAQKLIGGYFATFRVQILL